MEQKMERQVLAALAKAAGINFDPDNVVSQVVRTGDKIILPDGASIPEVIDNLKREYQKEEKLTKTSSVYNVPPWDGALALKKALLEILGFAMTSNGNLGIEVETSLGVTERVTWGAFELPGMGEGAEVRCETTREDGVMKFVAVIICKQRYEVRAKAILDRVREITATESLHKGKAFTMEFFDTDGDLKSLPTPKFYPLSSEKPVFRRELEASIERNVFVPLRHREALSEIGESTKRGVLFAGPYGTGKTMLASYIAREATKYGWTFMYVKDSNELPHALAYAQRYQPCVVFAEDVDRVGGLERTDNVNDLLNQLDGIDSKSAQIFTVLTTNHPEGINEAMRRPGRIDLVLHVLPPDAEAVGRMMHQFAKGYIAPHEDTSEANNLLSGFAPAYVNEAVKRARLEALRRNGEPSNITGEDLATTAAEVVSEKQFFDSLSKTDDNSLPVERLATAFEAASNILSGKFQVLSNTGFAQQYSK